MELSKISASRSYVHNNKRGDKHATNSNAKAEKKAKEGISDILEISTDGMECSREAALNKRLHKRNKGVNDDIENQSNKTNEDEAVIIDDENNQPTDIEEISEEIIQSENHSNTDEEDEAESEKIGGSIGINSNKLARMLAAAKTKSQVQAVISQLQADLSECEAGKAQGLEVDEATVAAAEQLLAKAKSLMGKVENRDATPEEEMAYSLA